MVTERHHRSHPTELKLRLVLSYLNNGGAQKSIAKPHDLTHTLLMLWVDRYLRSERIDDLDNAERAREAEAKIAALERKVGQLKMELNVLEKHRRTLALTGNRVSIICGPSVPTRASPT